MKTNFLPFFVSMLALLSTSTLLSAQTIAAVSMHRTQTTQRYTPESSPSLKTVLDNLQAKYGVNFLYKSQIGEQKIATSLPNSGNVEENLHAILTPNHLAFRKAGANLYAIMTADEAAKNAEAALQEKAPAQRTVVAMQVVAAPKEVAQTVNGTVKDATTGEVLTGVSVVVKGTTKGTATDIDGKYTLQVEPTDVLVFSFIGYTPQEVTVGDKSTLDVALEAADKSLSDVVVVGSRSTKPRTDVSRPAPVDVITTRELQATGQTDLGQMIQFSSPSFNSSKYGINGVANYADPATLRGMSPDQVLVLINGKRRHQFSALNLNVTLGRGTVVTDMNTIPAEATERIEVLRDGAAAQYGSDAIAGIVNIALKKSVNSGSFRTQYGINQLGDGATYMAAVNYGVSLGKPLSYANFTLNAQQSDGTNRSDIYNGRIYTNAAAATATAAQKTRNTFVEDSIRTTRGVWPKDAKVGMYGSNQTKTLSGFVNIGYPINEDWTLYSFGGYTYKDILAGAFFRVAIPTNANSTPEVFPDGYTPELPGKSNDGSFVAGVTRKVADGWNLDFSTGYGYNKLDLNANNTTNPSMGAASPKNFYVGQSFYGQSTSEANISKNYDDFLGTQSFNIAFGSQFRLEQFKLVAGDENSYKVGPLAASKNKAPGSSGRPGIAPEDQADETRTNIGIYADIETDITEKFLVAAAARFENYSDFGNNVSGKLATRLNLTENFAVRASVNRGFRAPSLQQVFNSVTTSTVQAGVIRQTKQLRNDDKRLAQIGIESPKAETSLNYNAGITAKAGNNFLFTLDAYQIDINDRIIISEALPIASITSLKTLFPGIQEVSFFTNHIGTRTRGIDFVTTYKQPINEKSGINTSLAFTFNKTEIISVKATPSALQAGTAKAIAIIDTISRSLIETSQPNNKIIFSLGYKYSKFDVNLRATNFGRVIAWEKPAGLAHRSQTFSAKTLYDITLSYKATEKITATIGANNATNVYPDKVFTNYASYFNGQTPYTRNANQFGFNGAYYFVSLGVRF